MAKLIYIANVSLDGYVEDERGGIDCFEPDEEVFRFIIDRVRPIGTYLYGRRMCEAMVYWETAASTDGATWTEEFGETWRTAGKIVYSKTLMSVSSAKTTIEREFDAEEVRRIKAAANADLTIGGAELATQAFRAGLVDECELLSYPIVLGGGKPALPRHARMDFELLEIRRFRGGVTHLYYRTTS